MCYKLQTNKILFELQKIELALQSSREGLSVKTHQHLALPELLTLRAKIIETLESILILTVSFVQDQALMNDISRVESCRRTLTFTLDYTRLDFIVS